MSTDRDVRRLNLVIKKWSAYSLSAMLTWSADDLADKFKMLTAEQIAELDAEIDNTKPQIKIPKSSPHKTFQRSPSAFRTPPRSSKSSEAVSKGCHSTP